MADPLPTPCRYRMRCSRACLPDERPNADRAGGSGRVLSSFFPACYNPTSAAPELSVDGKTYGPLASLRVATATGTTRAATADDVTHVRWRLARPITAGAQGQLAFEAVLR